MLTADPGQKEKCRGIGDENRALLDGTGPVGDILSMPAPRRSKSPGPSQLVFALDSPLITRVQNDRNVMAFPWFSLAKIVRSTPIEYRDRRVELTVAPGPAGLPTAWDKEFLVYVVSLMAQKLERGESVERTFTFAAADFFRVAGIGASGRSYERIEGALDRLQSVSIRTNIETGGELTKGFFSWLDEAEMVYRDTGEVDRDGAPVRVLDRVTVTVCRWLWRAVQADRQLYAYDPRFFDLPPLEQRLYEIARAHCGKAGFRMWLDRLQACVGSEDRPAKFKAKLVEIAQRRQPLPGYSFILQEKAVHNTGARGRPAKRVMVAFYSTRADSITRAIGEAVESPIVD
jgi:plasmid replication initiation protein